MSKKLHQWQLAILGVGTIFSFYTVVTDFMRFYDYEGTLLKVQDCVVPNPVTTPCFYGSFAFLAALVWSCRIYRGATERTAGQLIKLTWLLIASNLFAWGNFSRVAYSFYSAGTGSTTGCSGVLTTNPFTTPCFIGSAIFMLALLTTLILNRSLRHAPSTV